MKKVRVFWWLMFFRKRFSCLPVWTRQWSFMWCRSLKALPQNSHLNGRSPVCTGKCVINEDTSGKLLPQNLHKTTLPWSLLLDAPLPPDVELPPPPVAAAIAAAAAAAAANSISIEPSGGSRGSSSDGLCEKCASCGKFVKCNKWLVSRYFNVSNECDKMWRVNLLWCGNDAPQYMHW